VCKELDFSAHYTDPLDARIAGIAASLTVVLQEARQHGRPAPASVRRATDDLWRWAERSLIPRAVVTRQPIPGQEPLWAERSGPGD
jgi:hypothetical protein